MAVQKSFESGLPLIIAHRGGRYPGIPENTPAAVERALADGADIVELDVLMSRDGKLVLHHYPLLDIRGQYVRKRDSRHLPELATLEETLRCLNSRAPVYLDIKDPNIPSAALFKCVDRLHNNGVIIGSFSSPFLAHVRKLRPAWKINFHCLALRRSLRVAQEVGADWINPLPWCITRAFVQQIMWLGSKFVPAGTENYSKQLRYAQWGAYALSTFRPKELKAFLERTLPKRASDS